MITSKSLFHHQYKKHLIISLLSSLFLFLTLYNFLIIWVLGYYSAPTTVTRQTQEIVVSLQRYVLDNTLSTNDKNVLKQWNDKYPNVHLLIHSEDAIAYPQGETFLINFLNTKSRVTVIRSHEAVLKKNIIIWAILISFIFFLLLSYYLFWRRLSIIQSLREQLEKLEISPSDIIYEQHDFDDMHAIESSINNIKNILLQHVKKEKKQEQITGDILASLSHDFKTPITVIIGYLQIIKEQLPRDKVYIDKSIERAHYLHQLVDDTLYYFHSISLSDDNRDMERVNCSAMLDHYCSYQEALLENKFTFENHLTADTTDVSINELLMNRIFDNLISNIEKYADPFYSIHQTNYIEDGWFIFEQSNVAIDDSLKSVSTRLGLKTCQQIMSLHNGFFSKHYEGQQFVIRLHFPLE